MVECMSENKGISFPMVVIIPSLNPDEKLKTVVDGLLGGVTIQT